MKWFRHDVDSYSNLKHREILSDFGLEGYALYWICLELVGQQGVNYRLNGTKSWQKALKDISKLNDIKLGELLKRFALLNLICRKSLEKGDLYIPKMKDYSDEYTKRVRRLSEQGADKVALQYNTLQYITTHYITRKGWIKDAKENKSLMNELFKRNVFSVKKLYILAGGDQDKVIEAMDWFGDICDKRGLSWTLETVIKWFPEYLIKGKTSSYDKLLEKAGLKKG